LGVRPLPASDPQNFSLVPRLLSRVPRVCPFLALCNSLSADPPATRLRLQFFYWSCFGLYGVTTAAFFFSIRTFSHEPLSVFMHFVLDKTFSLWLSPVSLCAIRFPPKVGPLFFAARRARFNRQIFFLSNDPPPASPPPKPNHHLPFFLCSEKNIFFSDSQHTSLQVSFLQRAPFVMPVFPFDPMGRTLVTYSFHCRTPGRGSSPLSFFLLAR